MKKTIMAFGAHADDIDLRAGATLFKYLKLGYHIVYMTVTTSASGIPGLPPNEALLIRQEEARNAANLYHATSIFLNFQQCTYPDGASDQLPKENPPISVASHDKKSIEKIHQLIQQYQPELIFTHVADDLHEDHHHCSILITKAWSLTPSARLLYWEPGGRGSTKIFTPDIFVEVSEEEVDLKTSAIQKHVSQCQRSPHFLACVKKNMGRYILECGYPFAEGFQENVSQIDTVSENERAYNAV